MRIDLLEIDMAAGMHWIPLVRLERHRARIEQIRRRYRLEAVRQDADRALRYPAPHRREGERSASQ
jgi:hypothetical protein